MLTAFFAASYFRLIFAQESQPGLDRLGPLMYPVFGVPPWLETGAIALEIIFALGVLFVFLRRGAAASGPSAAIVFLPAAAQLGWFETGLRIPEFNALVPCFHSLQYLLIAWAMHVRERGDPSEASRGPASGFRPSLRWGILNVLGGVALFRVLPAGVHALGVPSASAVPVLFAAVQIHHFFIDGVIWKLRNPRVSAALVGDVVGGAPAGAETAA